MVQAGYPPKMLQEIHGHASITTTLDLCRYTCTPATWTSTQTAWAMLPPTPGPVRIRPK